MSADRSKVLFLTTRFPVPPDRGDRLHAYHLIRVLAHRFEVTVAAFEDDPGRMEEGRRLFEAWGVRTVTAPLPAAGRVWRLAGSLFSGMPLQVSYYAEPEMLRRLRALDRDAGPFDATVCHLIRTVPLAAAVGSRVRAISLCDALSLGLARRLSHAPLLERPSIWLETGRVRRYEERVMEGFEEGWVVSDVDRAAFGSASARIRVLPNGVDDRLFEGEPPADPPPVVGFLGHLGVPHNVDAAVFLVRQVFPLLKKRGIEATVRIIGPEPAPAVRALAGVPGVELAGFERDLRQAIQGLRVMCAPLRFSAGIQNKILEAVAAGVPAISSPAVVAALGPEATRWVRSAVTPDEYADAIAAAWPRSDATRRDLDQGREWIHSRFRWEAYADRLEELIASAAERPKEGRNRFPSVWQH